MYSKLLIVDDEPGLRSGLGKLLSVHGYRVFEAASSDEARAMLAKNEIHLVLLDLKLGQENGLDLLPLLRREEPGVPVIIITGHGDVASAVACIKAGASNYIEKPIDDGLLLSILERERLALGDRRNTMAFKQTLESVANRRMVRSRHPEMARIELAIEKVKDSDVPVLLLGETGTGKEIVARSIHYSGVYRDRPFVALNCASLNENLLESELFGHEKGAFSGAVARKIGRFELAGNGTLFLDEIGDMSLAMQSKLLRVLQEKSLERVGGSRPVTMYCRLIAATNKDLSSLRRSGAFRDDLYYRVATVTLSMPPLRERLEDLPDLVDAFIAEANSNYGRRVRGVAPAAMRRLLAHAWPGNIRQLKNVVTNAIILSDGEEITAVELPDGAGSKDGPLLEGGLAETVRRHTSSLERSLIRAELERYGWNLSQTASGLGISRKTLYAKMRAHSIVNPASPEGHSPVSAG